MAQYVQIIEGNIGPEGYGQLLVSVEGFVVAWYFGHMFWGNIHPLFCIVIGIFVFAAYFALYVKKSIRYTIIAITSIIYAYFLYGFVYNSEHDIIWSVAAAVAGAIFNVAFKHSWATDPYVGVSKPPKG